MLRCLIISRELSILLELELVRRRMSSRDEGLAANAILNKIFSLLAARITRESLGSAQDCASERNRSSTFRNELHILCDLHEIFSFFAHIFAELPGTYL